MNNELYHHGIEGQRWGRRNGPPYPLSKAENRAIRRQAKRQAKQEKILRKRGLSSSAASKYAKEMSDEQLNSIIDRLQREETYKKLVKKPDGKKSFKEKILPSSNKNTKTDSPDSFKNTARNIASNSAKTLSSAYVKKLADDLFKGPPKLDWYVDSTGKWTVKGSSSDIEKIQYYFDKVWKNENEMKKKLNAYDTILGFQQWQYNTQLDDQVLKLTSGAAKHK